MLRVGVRQQPKSLHAPKPELCLVCGAQFDVPAHQTVLVLLEETAPIGSICPACAKAGQVRAAEKLRERSKNLTALAEEIGGVPGWSAPVNMLIESEMRERVKQLLI